MTEKPKTLNEQLFPRFDLFRWRRTGDMPENPPEPTPEQAAESCFANMQTAARELAEARGLYDRSAPGSPELRAALGEMNRLRGEQKHWKGLYEWWRAKLPDRRMAREPGEDDER